MKKSREYCWGLIFTLFGGAGLAEQITSGRGSFLISAIVFAIGYVVLAGILAIEWGTCVSMTGVLWVGLSEHFFNNFIGNFLHVVSSTGTDEFQIIRIVLSNFLSLGIVLCINKKNKANQKMVEAE